MTQSFKSCIVIAAAGTLGLEELNIIKRCQTECMIVGADRAAFVLLQAGIRVDRAFGDFDSVSEEEWVLIRQKVPSITEFDSIDKDWTDTELAFQWALKQQPRQIMLFGAVGTRMDHTLSNVFMLRQALNQQIECVLIDEHNEIRLIDRSCTLVRGNYNNVSLLSLSDQTTGITLEGFQYPLVNAILRQGQSLGISNAMLGDTGYVSIESGQLLIIQSRD